MFEGFRAMAHLLEQLGEEQFAALIDSGNTGKVKDLCDTLIMEALPTEMIINGCAYDILGIFQEDDRLRLLDSYQLVNRAKDMSAHLGRDDGRNLLDHQDEIPVVFRDWIVFVFTDWRHLIQSECIHIVYWGGDRWCETWRRADFLWDRYYHVLRRKQVISTSGS